MSEQDLDIMEDPEIVREAIQGLQQTDPEVRQSALELLDGAGAIQRNSTLFEELLRVLLQLLAHERIESVAHDALRVFSKLLVQPIEALTLPGALELLVAPLPDVRVWLARCISAAPQIVSPNIGRELARGLREEPRDDVAHAFIDALEALENPLHEADLVELLAAPQRETRAYALQHLQPRAQQVLPRLQTLAESSQGDLQQPLFEAIHELRKPTILSAVSECFPELRPVEVEGHRFYELHRAESDEGFTRLLLLLSQHGQRVQFEFQPPGDAQRDGGIHSRVFLRRLTRLLADHFDLQLSPHLNRSLDLLVLTRTYTEEALTRALPDLEGAASELSALLTTLTLHAPDDAFARRRALLTAQRRKLERARARLDIQTTTRLQGLGPILWLSRTSPRDQRRAAFLIGIRERHLRNDASAGELILLLALREGVRPGPSTEKLRARFARTIERRLDLQLEPFHASNAQLSSALLQSGLPVLPHALLYIGHFERVHDAYEPFLEQLDELARFLTSFTDFIEQGRDPSVLLGLNPLPANTQPTTTLPAPAEP